MTPHLKSEEQPADWDANPVKVSKMKSSAYILLKMVMTYIQRCLSVPILPPWRWRRARMSLSSSTLLGTYHSSQHHLHQLLGTTHHHPSDNIKYAKCIIAMHHHFSDNLKNATYVYLSNILWPGVATARSWLPSGMSWASTSRTTTPSSSPRSI